MRPGLAEPVTELVVHIQGLGAVHPCLSQQAQPAVAGPEIAVDMRLGRPVAEPLGRGDRGVLVGDLVVPVAFPVEEQPRRPRQLPGVRVETELVGLADGGQQDLAFRGEPGLRVSCAGQDLRGDPGPGRRHRQPLPGRVEQPDPEQAVCR